MFPNVILFGSILRDFTAFSKKEKLFLFSNVIFKDVFLTAIWLSHGQLWAIIEEAASLTQC